MVKSTAQELLRKRVLGESLGQNWLTRFLNHHPILASRFGTCLDPQKVLASSPDIIRDFSKKVFQFLLQNSTFIIPLLCT